MKDLELLSLSALNTDQFKKNAALKTITCLCANSTDMQMTEPFTAWEIMNGHHVLTLQKESIRVAVF